jgi:hypothetical protein
MAEAGRRHLPGIAANPVAILARLVWALLTRHTAQNLTLAATITTSSEGYPTVTRLVEALRTAAHSFYSGPLYNIRKAAWGQQEGGPYLLPESGAPLCTLLGRASTGSRGCAPRNAPLCDIATSMGQEAVGLHLLWGRVRGPALGPFGQHGHGGQRRPRVAVLGREHRARQRSCAGGGPLDCQIRQMTSISQELPSSLLSKQDLRWSPPCKSCQSECQECDNPCSVAYHHVKGTHLMVFCAGPLPARRI